MADPYATVVICTTRHPQLVLNCLALQTFRNFEILIASERGIPNAMNRALQRARGQIFIRVDDDVEIPKKWLESLLMPFNDQSVCGATGPTFVPGERWKNRDSIRFASKPGWFLRWLYDNDPCAPAKIYKCGNVSYGSNFPSCIDMDKKYEIDHLEGTNWAMRTELIKDVGGFDEAFDGVSEWFDTDVEQKVKRMGYRLAYVPGAWLNHNLEKGEHYNDRFDGFGRIKNWIRYHSRYSKFHYKMVIYLLVWVGYFLTRSIKK